MKMRAAKSLISLSEDKVGVFQEIRL